MCSLNRRWALAIGRWQTPNRQQPTTNDQQPVLMHAFRQIFVPWFLPQGIASARWNVHKEYITAFSEGQPLPSFVVPQ